MKKVEITQFSHAEVNAPEETFGFLKIPARHELIRAEGENLEVSDGYHTFDDLYEHRHALFIALCSVYSAREHVTSMPSVCWCKPRVEVVNGSTITIHENVWRSKQHLDGSMFEGMFIVGIGREPGNQITYHLPISEWNATDFAETLENAPEWDGHTPNDVISRLKRL